MPPILLAALVSIVIAVMSLGQISPSIVNAIEAQNVNTSVAREGALAQQVMRYKANIGTFPPDMATLISTGYWRTADNNNGLGGTYTFAVDAAKGTIAVNTSIADAKKRSQYLASSRRTFKPVDLGGGSISTTYMIPTAAMSSTLPAGIIPVSATAPNPLTTAYWYDISSGSAILKVSNGVAWTNSVQQITAKEAPNATNIVASAAALPASAAAGDVRYVYNSATSAIDTMHYYNGAWVTLGSGTSPATIAALATSAITAGVVGSAYSYDFKPKVSAIFVDTYGSAPVNTANVRWFAMTALPNGLTLNQTTGVLSGTPTTSTVGTTVTIQAVYNNSTSAASYTLVITPAITALSTATLTVGTQNTAYTYDFKPLATVIAPITTANLTWAASGLPAGLSINASTGVLSGTPTGSTAGTTITITASYAGDFISRTYTVVVNAPAGATPMVAVGTNHACAITATGLVKCWGLNGNYQLGDGISWNYGISTTMATGAKQIGISSTATCAAMADLTMKCWGTDAYGHFGLGGASTATTPTTIAGVTGLTKVALGLAHGCGIFSGGSVKCWGQDSRSAGAIGDGTASAVSKVPSQVTGITSGATAISVGDNFACAVVSGGVKCWGFGANGQLGNNGTANSTTPVQTIPSSSGVVEITSGTVNSCAVYNTGVMKCWGAGWSGQNATTSPLSYNVPTATSGTQNYAKADLGVNNGCGLTTGGGVKCWGPNTGWMLGNNTSTLSYVPTSVTGIASGATQVSVGEKFACAQLATGSVKCWGNNEWTGGLSPTVQKSIVPIVVF